MLRDTEFITLVMKLAKNMKIIGSMTAQGYRLEDQGSIHGTGKGFLSAIHRPKRLCGPTSLSNV
jgi:hypothetical protein